VGLVQAAVVAKKGFETYAKCLASSKKHAQHLAKTAWFVRLKTRTHLPPHLVAQSAKKAEVKVVSANSN